MHVHAGHGLEVGVHGQQQGTLRHSDGAHAAALALQAPGTHVLGRQGLTGAAVDVGLAERGGEGAGRVLCGDLGAAVHPGDALMQSLSPRTSPVAAEAPVAAAAAPPSVGRRSGCATCSDEEGTGLSDSVLLPQMPSLPHIGPLQPVVAPEVSGAALGAGVQPGRGSTEPSLRVQDDAGAAAGRSDGGLGPGSLQNERQGAGPKAATCVGPGDQHVGAGPGLLNAAAAAAEAEVAGLLPTSLAATTPGLPSPPPDAAAATPAPCEAAQTSTHEADSFPPTIFTLHGYVAKATPPAQALPAAPGPSPQPPRPRPRRTSTPPGTAEGAARALAGLGAGAPLMAGLAEVAAASASVGAPEGVGQRHRAASCEVHPSWGVPSSGESSSDALLAEGGRQGAVAGRDGESAGVAADRQSSRQLWRAALGRARERTEQVKNLPTATALAGRLQESARVMGPTTPTGLVR